MKRSHIAVLSASAALLLVIVAVVVATRIVIGGLERGDYSGEVSTNVRAADLASGDLDLSGFERIDARGQWEVTLVQGADWDVALSYPEELEERLRVSVAGNRLLLGYERTGWGWWGGGGNRHRVRVRITMPVLSGVDLAGATTLDLSGFSGERLEIEASGATEIVGRDGAYEALELIVSGAGDIDLGSLPVDGAHIVLSGAGNVLLNMNGGVLSGSISGAGRVRYRGAVSAQNVMTAGFSSVEPLN